MEGITKSLIGLSLVLLCLCGVASAQDLTPGLPGKNVNIIGPTPANPALMNPTQERETVLRQQNEPSCTVRPENPAYIFCAFNDYRATDFPLVQGDSWMGVAWSADFGTTWYSRLAPGYKAHPNNLGFDFAADPNVVSAPGNSPGIVVLNYLAASRELDDGVMAIQRWAAMEQEDINYYAPENRIIEVDKTNSGRFADKPTLIAIVDPENQQSTQIIRMTLEDGSTVERNVPSATLVLCYSIFTGSNSSKVICKTSGDWGETWSKGTKLSEEQTRVQGVSLTNIGNKLLASWRRADSNKGDSIVTAVSTNGKTWSKGKDATNLCPIDQLATGAQIRMLDFPASANDGERFYLFAADRRFAGDGTTPEELCATGIPKIGVTWSDDGITWSPLQELDGPLIGSPEPAGNGYQYIPTAVGYRGNVQVAWYDTRRETYAYPNGKLPNEWDSTREPIQLRDYLTASQNILSRKADVYTVKIRGVNDFGQKIEPVISPSIRVSQYRTLLSYPATGEYLETPAEIEAHFPNPPIFVQGTRAFNGDYIAAAVPDFRKNSNGKWIQNSPSTLSAATDREDVWIAWGDTRDLRGNFLPKLDGSASPFTPNNMAATLIAQQQEQAEEEIQTLPAIDDAASKVVANSDLLAESEADSPAAIGLCERVVDPAGLYDVHGVYTPADRTRDANVYGSMVRHVSRFVALTPTKPLLGLQRTYPIVVSNPDASVERTFRLKISDQPSDFVSSTGRASWKQLPNKLFDNADPLQQPAIEIDVVVQPKSMAARTLFLVTTDLNATIPVDLYELTCEAGCTSPEEFFVKRITVGNGGLLDSEFCSNPQNSSACADAKVLETETHSPLLLTNPDLISPDLVSPDLVSPDLLSPDLVSPDLLSPDLVSLGLVSPDLVSPDLISPDLISPDLLSPDLISPDLISPDLISPDLLSPDLVSPDLVSPDLVSYSYQDLTYTVQNGGNVTTTYSADMSFNGIDDPNVAAQLIVWTTYVTPTSRNCDYGPSGEHQILVSKNLTDDELQGLDLPKVDDPFAGPVSFAARPGQVVNVTLRVFAPEAAFEEVDIAASTGFGVSAHSCNDPNDIDPGTDCLRLNAEKIVIDKTGPVFDGLSNGSVVPPTPPGPIEADREGGACVDLLGGLDPLVSASDSSPVTIACSLVSTGEPICTSGEVSVGLLSIPFMSDINNPLTAAQVSCTATDTSLNSTTIQIGVAVADTTAPELTGPASLLPEEAHPFSGEVALGPVILALESVLVANDVADPDPVISCFANTSEASVGPGEYFITCNASDESNNFSDPDLVYELRVIDVTPPVLSGVPGDMPNVEANTVGGATVTYTPTATDSAGTATVECIPASGELFVIGGPTTVNCIASDDAIPPNTATASFDITVRDSTAPVITLTGDNPMTLQAGTSYIEPGYSAFDIFEGSVPVTVTGSVNSGVPGLYTINYSASDVTAGNTSSIDRAVTVIDTLAPTFGALPVIAPVEAVGPGGAVVIYTVSATDLSAGGASVSCTPVSGSTFPVGITTVNCTASDTSSPPNTAPASFDITVSDSTAPTVNASDIVVELIDANVDIDINYITGEVTDLLPEPDVILIPASGNVVASDLVDPNPTRSCYIVNPNDPDDMTNTANPQNFMEYATSTVSCTATDTSNNTSSATTFDIGVSFPYGIELILPKGQAKANSTIPIDWRYLDTNGPVDSSMIVPTVTWNGRFADNDFDCSGDSTDEELGHDAGASGKRYSPSSMTWQFSWQTPDLEGRFLLAISPPGNGVLEATACVRLR